MSNEKHLYYFDGQEITRLGKGLITRDFSVFADSLTDDDDMLNYVGASSKAEAIIKFCRKYDSLFKRGGVIDDENYAKKLAEKKAFFMSLDI